MAARIYVDASDGRSYTPDGRFHRAMMVTDRHYFHMSGDRRARSACRRATIEALRGWEYKPKAVTVDVRRRRQHRRRRSRLERLIDLPARGWYSGDTHVHDLHQGFGLSHEAFFLQLTAEDLHVTNALIHMDGTRLMGRWSDLTGKPSPLSTSTHILQYAEEFRGGLGHIGMLGVREFTCRSSRARAARRTRSRRSTHPYLEARARAGRPRRIHASVHQLRRARPRPRRARSSRSTLALGLGDFYDIGVALLGRAGVGGLLLSFAQRRVSSARDRRDRQLLRRLARSAAGIGSHVRASSTGR